LSRETLSIFFFSGSGNTEHVANLFSSELSSDFDIKLINIDNVIRKGEKFDDDFHKAGLIYPVHALNAPKNVIKFLKKHLPKGKNRSFFIVKSPGDPFFNGGATYELRKILSRKGYEISQEETIVMPANVFLGYRKAFIEKILITAQKRVKDLSKKIVTNRISLHKNPLWLRFSTWFFSRLESYGSPIFGKDLRVNSKCNSCELCQKVCPTGNIKLIDGKPKFGWKCLICMRCIYKCPQDAIAPRFFGFFKVKNYYNINKFKDLSKSYLKYKPTTFEKGFNRYFGK